MLSSTVCRCLSISKKQEEISFQLHHKLSAVQLAICFKAVFTPQSGLPIVTFCKVFYSPRFKNIHVNSCSNAFRQSLNNSLHSIIFINSPVPFQWCRSDYFQIECVYSEQVGDLHVLQYRQRFSFSLSSICLSEIGSNCVLLQCLLHVTKSIASFKYWKFRPWCNFNNIKYTFLILQAMNKSANNFLKLVLFQVFKSL